MLKIVRARSGGPLVAHLSGVLAEPPADPFADDLVVVHSRGMERWLSQQLARHLGTTKGTDAGARPAPRAGVAGHGVAGHGVAAALEFPSPAVLVQRVVAASGQDRRLIRSWMPDALAWQILKVHEDHISGGAGDGDAMEGFHARMRAAGHRRVGAARTIALHLHRYALHRPDVVHAWVTDPEGDALGAADVDRWQPALYRALAEDHAETHVGVIHRAVQALRAGADLPPDLHRLTLFGFTEIPALHMALLAALGEVADVHVLLLHPSPAAWDRATDQRGELADGWLPVLPPRPSRASTRSTRSTRSSGSTLFTAWGRNVAEAQALVQTVAGEDTVIDAIGEDDLGPPGTVLERLQAAVIADDDAAAKGPVHEEDRSISVHACTGPARQVQVLRDEILHALDADPTLQPRDIVVMCPDVEVYAPLVAAHLAGGGAGRPDLRVRIADRALPQTNPLLRLIQTLLRSAATRLSAGTLIDLASSDPVARRFGFDDRAVERLTDWVTRTNVRWGLDADDRTAFRMQGLRANTLAEGLDRLLAGVALMDEDMATLGDLTPHDDMEGESVVIAGRFAEFGARLQATVTSLQQPQTAADWADVLSHGVDALAQAARDQPGHRSEVARVLREVVDWAADAGTADQLLDLDGIRDVLDDRLAGSPSRANHMTGDLTVCTLVPMRSVPHRVICLLGMDDDAFPRRARPHVDDLLGRSPRMADHDAAAEDRQLMLDALMATAEQLIILHTGVDERTGEPVPPCAPVAELLRVIDEVAPGHAARITAEHPLSAHDPAAFTGPRPSFDPHGHAAAVIRVAAATEAGAGTASPTIGASLELPTLPAEVMEARRPQADVTLTELHRFLVDPFKAYCRESLGLWAPDDPELLDESIPWTVSSLDGWAVGDRLLRGRVTEPEVADAVVANLRGRGFLPPSPLGDGRIDEDVATVGKILDVAASNDIEEVQALPMSVVIGERTLSGVVDATPDGAIVHLSYSSLKGKTRMALWLQLLLACAAEPDRDWHGVLIGRRGSKFGPKPAVERFEPVGETPQTRRRRGQDLLADLMDLRDAGLRSAVIAPADTAFAYAEARQRGEDAVGADDRARKKWGPSDRGWASEIDEPMLAAVLGDAPQYDLLTARPARPDDEKLGQPVEPHELGGLAMRIWAPLLTNRRTS